jgi:DNA mismatch repair protein MutS2
VEARRQVGQELDRLKAEDVTRRQAQEAYHRLRSAEAELRPPPAAPLEAEPLAVGEVRLRTLGLRGRVVAEEAETVTVQAGRLTVRVPRSELEAVPGAGAAPAGPRPTAAARAATVSVPARDGASRELHLLGWTTDEARPAVEKFLDDAVLAGFDSVRIVHGKGTGALRRAVEELLRGHPLVARFRPGGPGEGGTGATVVDLVEDRQP